MSRTGQIAPRRIVPSASDRRPLPERPLVALSSEHAGGLIIDRHRHDFAQLVYAEAGLIRVSTTVGTWVVPAQRAVWVPAGIDHAITAVGPVIQRIVHVLPATVPRMPAQCCVMAVSPLLRELVTVAVALPADYALDGPAARLVGVLVDELRAEPLPQLHLPMPHSRRLRVVADGLVANPADPRGLNAWASASGASVRTLARLFQHETGMGFRAWRQQLRLHDALARLAAGEPVTQVAYAVGYDSPSAFIAMFRGAMGESPRRYLRPAPLTASRSAA